MVIGAQREDKDWCRGRTLEDRREWTFLGELGIKDKTLKGTYMYECPPLLSMRDERLANCVMC